MSEWGRRAGVFVGLGLLLVVDGALWAHAYGSGRMLIGQVLWHPERVVGQSIPMPLVEVEALREGSFTINYGDFSFDVQGEAPDLQVGDELYLRGRLTDARAFELEWYERAPDRPAKKLLGVMGLVLVGVVCLAGLEVDREGVRLRG